MAKTGQWGKLKKVMKQYDDSIKKNATVALQRSGIKLEGMIKDRSLSGKDMKPNHPFTVQMKGSSKPLIDNADLVQSVGFRFVQKNLIFVGVNRKNERGVNIAAIHEREKGTRIKVTPRMRRYLHAHGMHLKPSTKVLFIPGRPYLKPAYRDFKEKGILKELFKEAVVKTLKGK